MPMPRNRAVEIATSWLPALAVPVHINGLADAIQSAYAEGIQDAARACDQFQHELATFASAMAAENCAKRIRSLIPNAGDEHAQ